MQEMTIDREDASSDDRCLVASDKQ